MSFFNYNRSEYSLVFNEAVDVVDKLLVSDDNVYKICNPVAIKYPKDRKEFTEIELVAGIKATLSRGIAVQKGVAEELVVQMNRFTNTMYINEEYCILPNSASDIERKRCKLMLIVKVLHGVFHALTDTFWAICGFPLELNEDGTTTYLHSTPLHLGPVCSKNKIIGDNGYAFEEAHLRGRLLNYPDAGYSSQLHILVPADVLRESKIYIIPDERAVEVLKTLETTTLKNNPDLSLYCAYHEFKPKKKGSKKATKRPSVEADATADDNSSASRADPCKKARLEAPDPKDGEPPIAGLHVDGLNEAPVRSTKSAVQEGVGALLSLGKRSEEGSITSDDGEDPVKRFTHAVISGGAKN